MLHEYEDTFRVTGLQVTKSAGYEAAAIGTPTEHDDLYLFKILLGLNDTFMEYEKLEGQADDETALQALSERFAAGSTATITQTFGVPANYVAMGGPTRYAHVDEGVAGLGSQLVPDLLQHYDFYYGSDSCRDAEGNAVSCASLLVAYEQKQGVFDLKDLPLSDSHFADPSALHVSLSDVPLLTMRGVQLRMYEKGSGGWQIVEASRMLDIIEQRYAGQYDTALRDLYPSLRADDMRFIAYTAYMWGYAGRIAGIREDARLLVPAVPDENQLALNRALTPEQSADADTAVNYLALVTGFPEGIKSGIEWGQGIYEAVGLRTGWGNLSTAAKFREGCLVGFGIASTAAGIVMGGISLACQVKSDLDVCRNEAALEAANAAVNSLGIVVQTAGIVAMIYKYATNSLEAVSKLGKAIGAVGLVIGIGVTWASFGIAVATSSDPITWRVALSMAIVETVWLVFLFAINFIPIVGQIISAILSAIDAIISLFTGLFTDETWSVAKIVLNLFYDAGVLTTLSDAEFGEFQSALVDEDLGMVGGNTFKVSVDASGVMTKTGDGSDDDLRQSYVQGNLLPWPLPNTFTWQDMSSARDCAVVDGELHCSNTAALGYALVPRINGVISFLADFTYQYRWAEYGCYGAWRWKTHSDTGVLPDPEADGYEPQEPSTLYLDVPPATLDAVWTWSALANPDRDGDGLTDQQESALGTNPQKWDTDGDGLSDEYEWRTADERGADPLLADTDGDGLSDSLEVRLGTRVDVADTDGDGLLDGDEVRHFDGQNVTGGWQVSLPGGHAAWVSSDPLRADADCDGLNDAEEKANGLSPYEANQPVPALSLDAEPLSGIPGGRAGMYLEPGDPVTLTVQLANWATDPVTGTLSLSAPGWLTDFQGGQLVGDSALPRAGTGSQFSWSFAGVNALGVYEAASTTITARVDPATSSGSGEFALALPYGGVALAKTVTAVMDGDNPTVSLLSRPVARVKRSSTSSTIPIPASIPGMRTELWPTRSRPISPCRPTAHSWPPAATSTRCRAARAALSMRPRRAPVRRWATGPSPSAWRRTCLTAPAPRHTRRGRASWPPVERRSTSFTATCTGPS